ncbi:hypothetical protein LZ30DRAFT_749493 [Colletotrichum cereale]|nr:hypothetical protein LZ30DRAFT_749493 [Colletotrichum cereale]
MTSSTGPTGAAPPPPGEKPNFDSPRDVGHFAHTLYMCFIEVIVVFFFAVRVCVKLELSDWMGLHHHPPYDHFYECVSSAEGWMYAGSLLYSPAAFFTKTSILLLTVRVFSIDKTVARTLHLLLAFILICYIPAEVAKAAVCIPVQSFWDLSIVEHKCIDQTKLFLYDSSLSVFSDLFILIVPIVLTSRMKVPLLKKIKIVGLLGTGGVGVAVTVYRIYLVAKYDKSTDPTMDFVPLDWTVTGELAIGMACACIPSIHHVWEQRAARAVPSSRSRGLLMWWREASKRYYDALSSWGRAHVCRMPTFRRRKARSIDSVAVLDATPDSENGEPKKLDYDVELAALSASHPGPHPGELVHPGVEGHGQNWLIPLPVIRRSSPFKLNRRP